jgi:hypothetical protein
MQKENWINIFNSKDLLQAKLAEDVLKQAGIESHIVNAPDSVFPPLGEAKLFTPPEKAETARKILLDNDFS